MKFWLANFFDADRRSCIAGEAMDVGQVIAISDNGSGARRALKVTNANQCVPGIAAMALKVSPMSDAVTASTVNADTGKDLGARIVTIASGDAIVECRRGSIGEYFAADLDDSLNPAATVPGVTPTVGQVLGVKNGRFCDTTAASALVPTVPFAKVFRVFGTKVLVELI